MVDDSIVRGTTCGKIVHMLKSAGAREVHVRVASPPVTDPCFFGIDTPDKSKLVAAHQTVEEIREKIGADSLGYLSVDGMLDAIGPVSYTHLDVYKRQTKGWAPGWSGPS